MLMNNILAFITIILAGISFFFIFRSLFLELIQKGVLTRKDTFFMLLSVVLVFIVYFFLETLHH